MPVLRARVLTSVGPDEVNYWEDGVVVVEGEHIVEVGPYDGLPVDDDLRPALLTPGFVDAHVHFPQARIVGAAAGPLLEWLERSVFPEEARFADEGYAAEVAESFVAALAGAGTTLAMIYGSVHAEACEQLLQALDRRGLRAIAGPVLMDEGAPPALLRSPARALDELAELEARWRGHDRLQVAAIPRFALSCSTALMTEAARLAGERGMWVSTHVAENREECRLACERFGSADYLEVYESLGLIHERTVLAHCIHFSSDEWDRLARAGAVVAHCP
ncbi:MAG: amidohydrolase family protein, partial [Myxococcales bacterium]|nr:amidohydrolase family protein [Myxococcales bacterium]